MVATSRSFRAGVWDQLCVLLKIQTLLLIQIAPHLAISLWLGILPILANVDIDLPIIFLTLIMVLILLLLVSTMLMVLQDTGPGAIPFMVPVCGLTRLKCKACSISLTWAKVMSGMPIQIDTLSLDIIYG